jgi:hypothetical protein
MHTKNGLPTHAKRHTQLTIMRGSKGCPHALSRHEDITDPRNGKVVTISYALPCVSKAQRKHTHFDVYKREWN